MTEKDYEKIDWSKYIAPGDDVQDNLSDEDDLKEDLIDDDNADLDSDEEIAALQREALQEERALSNMSWKASFDKRSKS